MNFHDTAFQVPEVSVHLFRPRKFCFNNWWKWNDTNMYLNSLNSEIDKYI